MSESHAEQLDPSVLGERVGDERRPAADFPPDEPLAVDDPNIVAGGVIARDDVESREARHTDRGVRADDASAPGLIEPGDDPDVRDDEQQMVADAGDRVPEAAAEAAAVHVTDSESQ